MAWHDPSEASANCTGFAATSAPPSAGGSSTLKECAPVRISTSVTPTSVPWAANRACAVAGSSATALCVSAMSELSELSDTADLPGRAEHIYSLQYRPILSRKAVPYLFPWLLIISGDSGPAPCTRAVAPAHDRGAVPNYQRPACLRGHRGRGRPALHKYGNIGSREAGQGRDVAY